MADNYLQKTGGFNIKKDKRESTRLQAIFK